MTHALVVEDSRTQARHVQSVLQDAGFAVTVAHDGAAGLDAALHDPPDVVLSDVLMPELGGFELCLALRRDARTAAVPIVIMTSLTDSADVLRALACGADGYVSKPVRDDVLVHRVRGILRPHAPITVNVQGRDLSIDAPREKILHLLTCALEDAAARHEELAASRAHLEAAKAQQDELMGIVAHELRTPLNVLALRAAIETGDSPAKPGGVPSPLPRLADLVDRNVRAMTVIVDDLLDVARIESGDIRVQPRMGDLAEIVRDVVERFAMVSARHPIEMNAPARQLAMFDPARVEQILANLLSNAIKYSPDGGRIEVRVRREAEAVRVDVEDRGIGLPADFEERLFRRYARAPGSERVAKGVGLGLYITRRLLELQGGRIRAANVAPRGACFSFTLPPAD